MIPHPVATPETSGERLKIARISLGLSMEAFGAGVGKSRPTISLIEGNKHNLAQDTAQALELVYGTSWRWLLTGEGEMFVRRSTGANEATDVVFRPLVVGAATCGPGGEIADPGPGAATFPFRESFLQDLLQESGAGAPGDLYVVECCGESMRPTVHPGDMALINTSLELRMHPKRCALYLVRPDPASSDARIKRIRLDGNGQLWFLSDAPGFSPVSVDINGLPLQSLILGRVCWIGRSVVKDERLDRNW